MPGWERHILPEVLLFYPAAGASDDLSHFIQSIRTYNSVHQPVGTLNLVLNPSLDKLGVTTITTSAFINYWKQKIKINSVISVKIDRTSTVHSFLGFVDQVYESTIVNDNSSSRTLVVNCSMLLPKLLLRDNIVNSPILSANPVMKEQLGDRVQFFSWMRGLTKDGKSPFVNRPEEAIKYILENMPATHVQMGGDFTPQTFFSNQFVDINNKPLMDFTFLDGEFLFDVNLTTYTGPIYNYILSCIDKDFYQVFTETTTSKDGLARNSFVIRPKPFSFKNYQNPITNNAVTGWVNFEDLSKNADGSDKFVITSDGRLSENLSVSDFEAKNYFVINFLNSLIASQSSYLSKFGLSFPVVNIDGIKKFGLRDMIATSTLINYKKIIDDNNRAMQESQLKNIDQLTETSLFSGNNSMLDYLLNKREKIVEWFAYPYFMSGQITVPGSDSYKIGERFVYKRQPYYDIVNDVTINDGVHYHIDSVAHNFAYGGFFTSTLGLSRGIPLNLAANWLNTNRKNFISIETLQDVKKFEASNSNKFDLLQQIDLKDITTEFWQP